MFTWEFTLYALPLFIGLVLLAVVAVISWQQRAQPSSRYLFWLSIAFMIYVFGYAMELGSTSVEAVQFWRKVELIGGPASAALMLMMAMAYTGHDRYLTPPVQLVILSPAALATLLTWTNEYHGLMWENMVLDRSGGYTAVLYDRNWIGTLLLIIAVHGVLLLGIGVLALTLRHATGLYRRQIIAIIIGAVMTMPATLAYRLGIGPPLDTTPYGVSIIGVVLSLGIHRFQLFDPLPIASDVIIESINEAVITVDLRDRVVKVNPAALKLLGKACRDVISKPLAEVLPTDTGAIVGDTRYHQPVDRLTLPVDGEMRVFTVTVQPLFWRGGNPAGKVLILRDVTLEEAARQREMKMLFQAERLNILAGFISNASHEFRTPLSVIGNCAYILNKLSPDDKSAAQVGIIKDQAGYINRLVEGMLTMLRLEEKTHYDRQPLLINHVLHDVATRLRPQMDKKGLALAFDLSEPLPMIDGDEEELFHVFFHLLENAIQHTPAGGTVILRSAAAAEAVVVDVADTGSGIPAEHLPHLFEHFYHVDKAQTERGVGLGLSIAEKIVTMHGGAITVESTVGVGSTFRVTLPIASVDFAEGDTTRV